MQDSNPFDAMPGLPTPEQIAKIKAENEQLGNKLDNLIHRTFKQNEAGAELLALWTEALLTQMAISGNMSQIEVGIAEGKREFIRNIILTIRKVEGA